MTLLIICKTIMISLMVVVIGVALVIVAEDMLE